MFVFSATHPLSENRGWSLTLSFHCLMQCVHEVQLLPRELLVVPSEVSICGCLSVNRAQQVKPADDTAGSQVHLPVDDLCDFFIRYPSGTEGVDVD